MIDHVYISVTDVEKSLTFYEAGGIDEGGPAERIYFAPGYYAANVADFDGNRL